MLGGELRYEDGFVLELAAREAGARALVPEDDLQTLQAVLREIGVRPAEPTVVRDAVCAARRYKEPLRKSGAPSASA